MEGIIKNIYEGKSFSLQEYNEEMAYIEMNIAARREKIRNSEAEIVQFEDQRRQLESKKPAE